ncbi:hypothetical protein RJ55_02892 [Drechmeria coniospora]|nr:hypothetical protein RJ55_02892 [Drechmeria coniospora]
MIMARSGSSDESFRHLGTNEALHLHDEYSQLIGIIAPEVVQFGLRPSDAGAAEHRAICPEIDRQIGASVPLPSDAQPARLPAEEVAVRRLDVHLDVHATRQAPCPSRSSHLLRASSTIRSHPLGYNVHYHAIFLLDAAARWKHGTLEQDNDEL